MAKTQKISTVGQLPKEVLPMYDSQDIAAVREHLPRIPKKATMVAVSVENGDYEQVFYSTDAAPYLNSAEVVKVK